jgi:hypothetical protein
MQRLECGNNLHQIGIACAKFHDDYSYLPPSRLADHWATWAVLILPNLEQGNTYNLWDLSKQYYLQPNPAAVATSVPSYFCPGRRAPGGLSKSGDVPDNGSPDSLHHPGALSDYAASSGDFQYTSWLDGVNANGAFKVGNSTRSGTNLTSWSGVVRFTDVTDGLSKTFLVGEKQVVRGQEGIGTNGGAGGGDGSIYNGDNEWNFARVAGPGYALAKSPTDTTQKNNVFGGPHFGVVLFVMCDGSVHPIPITTSTTILGYLSRRDDGQPTPDF